MVYPIFRFLVYTLRVMLIKRIKGIDNIPHRTTFIIVSNHEKLIDPLYILYTILKKLNKKIHFLATPTWWFLGDIICRQWAGCIPLFNTEQAYKEAKRLVESSEIIGIFPEGGTRRTKNPKTGAVRLALETNTPILPIAVKSSYVPFNSRLKFGKLIHLRGSKRNIRKLAKDLMLEVYKLRDSLD